MISKFDITAINYKQNDTELYTFVLPYDIIDQHSEVLIYGKHPQGYQREPEEKHYNKIRDYIVSNKDFLLPTSIILAIDKNEIDLLINKKSGSFELNIFKLKPKKKVFRIVDGQHRIIAMREAVKFKNNLKSFKFNVIVLVTKPNKRSIEMEVFYNINSKGKRLKVDLIELARFNYRILEKSLNEKEINEHISIQTAYHLNEKIKNSIWTNAIKFGIHDEEIIGIIGVNAFRESISGIVDAYIKGNDNYRYKTLSGEKLIEYSKKAAKYIADFIHEAWDDHVKRKWTYCFTEGQTQLDLFLETKKYYYDSKYYIQRTMGTKAINSIISMVVNERHNQKIRGLNNTSMKEFARLVNVSKITGDDWKIGGTFSGYSSESGFKKVSQFILNKLEVPRIL